MSHTEIDNIQIQLELRVVVYTFATFVSQGGERNPFGIVSGRASVVKRKKICQIKHVAQPAVANPRE